MEPLAESSPKPNRRRSVEATEIWSDDEPADENSSGDSDSDSLGEELLNDFQGLVSDARNLSRSMTSLDGSVTSSDKVRVLASCIQDLDQQKEVLFSTISRLECSSSQRAVDLGRMLTATSLHAKELEQKSAKDDQTIASSSRENEDLRSDVETLLAILSTAFCDGEWECVDAELSTVESDRLPGKHGALSVEGLHVLKLQTKLSEQRSELDAFRREVTRLRDLQTADLQHQFVQLQDELVTCRSQGEGLHDQLSAREAELQRLNNSMTELTHEITEKDENSAGDQALIQQLQQQYESCHNETTKLKSTIEELEPQVSCLTHDVMRLEKELATSQCSGHVAQQEVENLKVDLELVQSSAAQDTATWKAEIEKRDAALGQLQQELAAHRSQYTSSAAEIREREEKISQLELLQARCTADILEREKAITDLKVNLTNTESRAEEQIQSLQQKKSEVENQLICRGHLLAAITVELSAIRRHYKDCCEELQRLDDAQQEITERRSVVDRDCEECGAQIAHAKQQLSLLAPATGVTSARVDSLADSLATELAACSRSSPSTARSHESPSSSSSSLHSELELRDATLLELRAELDECQRLYTRVSDHVDERQRYLETIQPAYQTTENEVQVCRSKIVDLQQQINDLQIRQADVSGRLADRDAALQTLRVERAQQQTVHQACCEQVQQQQQCVDSLIAQHDDVLSQVSEHIEAMYQLRSSSGDSVDGLDMAGTEDADRQTSTRYQSKLADFQELVGRGDSMLSGTLHDENVFSRGNPLDDSHSPTDGSDSKREILLSAMVQREEALAWLRVHNDALQRLQKKTSADVERRRVRITDLEQQLGVVR